MSAAPKKVTSFSDLPAKCYEIVRRNWKLFLIINLIPLIGSLLAFGDDQSTDDNQFSNLSSSDIVAISVFGIALILLYGFFTILSLSLQLRASKGQLPTFSDVLADFKKYWLRLVGLFIVMVLIVVAGFILLIIPGILAAIFISFAPYFMLDKDMGIKQSLRASYELVRDNIEPVAVVILLSILIGIAVLILDVVPVLGTLLGTVLTIIFAPLFAVRYLELVGKPTVTK